MLSSAVWTITPKLTVEVGDVVPAVPPAVTQARESAVVNSGRFLWKLMYVFLDASTLKMKSGAVVPTVGAAESYNFK